jgi:hypothetical protein
VRGDARHSARYSLISPNPLEKAAAADIGN